MTCPLKIVKVQLIHTRQSLMHMRRFLPHLPGRSKVTMSTHRMPHTQPQQCQRVGVATRKGDETALQELNVD